MTLVIAPTAEAACARAAELVAALLAARPAAVLALPVGATPRPVLTYDRHVKSEPQNWPTYWGDYAARHFSDLTQINTGNVKSLRLSWTGTIASPNGSSEASPIVVDGVMYFSTPGEVVAYDAVTGIQKWAFHRKQDLKNPAQNNANVVATRTSDNALANPQLSDWLMLNSINCARNISRVPPRIATSRFLVL